MESITGSVDQQTQGNKNMTPPIVEPKSKQTEKLKPQLVEKSKIVEPRQFQYKLNVFSHNGLLKQSIPAAVYQDMTKRHGDIMRCVSSTKWQTIDEILELVWRLEKRMKYPSNRTRPAVERALQDLIEREFVITK